MIVVRNYINSESAINKFYRLRRDKTKKIGFKIRLCESILLCLSGAINTLYHRVNANLCNSQVNQ